MDRLSEAQRELLRKVTSFRMEDGTPLPTLRPLSHCWYDARPDNAKIDRLIRRGFLEECKPGFIRITEAGRAALSAKGE